MSSSRVGLFITCLTDQYYPQVGIAVTKILERNGFTVEFPQAQTCCGQPFFNNGYHKDAADLAKRFIEIFEGYDYIVTPSGSCAASVREQYQELLGNDPVWKERYKKVHDKTFEFVEFVTKVMKLNLAGVTLPEARTYTYHYTCHQRGLGMKEEAVNLLKKVGNVNFVPLEKTDQCCGFGGTFAIKYPAISGAIVEDKIDCIRKTGAQYTVCNDAGCTMNIAGMCHRHDVKTEVTHIAMILAEAMGIDVTAL